MNLLQRLLRDNSTYLVIIVCTANRARSPYAVARLNAMFYEYEQKVGRLRKPLRIRAIGAGVKTTLGEGPLPEVVNLSWERALDITSHIAVPFDVKIEKRANLILTMENKHGEILMKRFSETIGRVFRLTDYKRNGIPNEIGDIPDPTHGGEDAVREISDIIDTELFRIFPHLLTQAKEKHILT